MGQRADALTGTHRPAAARHWALAPAVTFAALSLLLALPPLGLFFLYAWPVHLILAILGIVFGGVASAGSHRGQRVLAVSGIVVSSLAVIYVVSWIGYWQLLSLTADRPPGF